jgi:hypothetical protein
MKTLFTRDEILQNVGCYSQEDAVKILKDKTEFTINEILSLDVPLGDKAWFVLRRCELTDTEISKFAIESAWVVLPIFEDKYPKNKAPREAIQAAEQYLLGNINIDILKQKCTVSRASYTAAAAAVDAAYTAAAAADAAYSASYTAAAAADDAADAAYSASYTAAAAAAAAASAASDTKYQDLLLNFFKSFTE